MFKQILNIDKTSETIPTLIYNNKEIERDSNKDEIFKSFFISQSQINDTTTRLSEPIHPQNDLIDSFTITSQIVFNILNGLGISKASGPDLVNPRLLKEGASCLSATFGKLYSVEMLVFLMTRMKVFLNQFKNLLFFLTDLMLQPNFMYYYTFSCT